jgi:hypothetical protein
MYTKSGTQNIPHICCPIPGHLLTHLLTCKSPARSPIHHAALACTNPKASRVAYIHTSPPRVDPPSPLKRLPLSPPTIKSTPSIIDPQCTSAKRGRSSSANVTERSGPDQRAPSPSNPTPLSNPLTPCTWTVPGTGVEPTPINHATTLPDRLTRFRPLRIMESDNTAILSETCSFSQDYLC